MMSEIEKVIVAKVREADSPNLMPEIEDFIIAKIREKQPNLTFEAAWHIAREAIALIEDRIKYAARDTASLVEERVNEQ